MLTRARWCAGVTALLLLVLHFDIHLGLRERSPEMLLGWLPMELAWRLGWMGLAWIWLVVVIRFVWRAREEGA